MSLLSLKKQIGIVGDGAVGFAFTALWRQQGNYEVVLFGRHGLSKKKKNLSLFGKPSICVEQMDIDIDVSVWVFVTKAYDLAQAVTHIKPLVKSDALVIGLTNGYLKEIFQDAAVGLQYEQLRMGVTTFAAREGDDGTIFLSNDVGAVVWGPLSTDVAQTAMEFDLEKHLPGFRWEQNPWPSIRTKWLANVVINGLCAAEKLATNGLLEEKQALVRATVAEAYRFGEELWGEWPESLSFYETQIFKLIRTTAENENSMVRDMRLGRKTEADFLFGLAGKRDGYPILRWLTETLSS